MKDLTSTLDTWFWGHVHYLDIIYVITVPLTKDPLRRRRQPLFEETVHNVHSNDTFLDHREEDNPSIMDKTTCPFSEVPLYIRKRTTSL